jgi:nucleoside-diphosphate-sugar epimerase
MSRRAAGHAEVLLFTGFPGFIGARLIPRLLELVPDAELRLLVQPKFEAKARADVVAIGRAHPGTRGRLQIVLGDITEERLGLGASAARALQKELTGAFHLAAVYDLAVRREVGMRINVEGTRNVLSFLEGARSLERLHYVSTAYVSGTAVGVYRENDLDVGQGFKNAYEETKFLAERLVVDSGVPQVTYRPGIVVGDSRSGETAKFDGPYFVLSAMEKMPSPGIFMKIGSGGNPVNLVPVDYVVEALARLAASEAPVGRTYHLTDPQPLTALEIADLLARSIGKTFLYTPMPLAAAKLLFRPRLVQEFFGMPVQALDYFDHPCRYDASQASAELGARGVSCPRLPDYLQRLVAFYLERKGRVRREAMI